MSSDAEEILYDRVGAGVDGGFAGSRGVGDCAVGAVGAVSFETESGKQYQVFTSTDVDYLKEPNYRGQHYGFVRSKWVYSEVFPERSSE